jgi:general stress protein 26
MTLEQRARAVAFLREHPITHLATADGNGPAVRVMSLVLIEDDGTLWYASFADSEKMRHIRQSPQVALSAFADGTAVEITGRAEIVDDAESRHHHWHDSWRDYFPGGPDDANYALIRVTPAEITIY